MRLELPYSIDASQVLSASLLDLFEFAAATVPIFVVDVARCNLYISIKPSGKYAYLCHNVGYTK